MTAALKIVGNNLDRKKKKDYINWLAQNEPKTGVLFSDFIQKTVARKAKRMGPSYIRNYKTLLGHIYNFSEIMNANIYTNSVNEMFLDDFIFYLKSLNLRLSYVNTLISLVLGMVKKAGLYGYAVDPSYDDIKLQEEQPFSTFLSMNEITRMYYFKGLSTKKERIKDLFVVGCLTALRYSDYSSLIPDNFQGNYIIKVTKKTGKKVIIPIHDYIKEIYKKYKGIINFNISLQHFNRYIKLVCKEVGFVDEIIYNETIGNQLICQKKPKWQLISSHTARRSAATNMYLTGRMKTFEIMAITGHTTEKSFFRYIRVTDENKAQQIAGDNFFRK